MGDIDIFLNFRLEAMMYVEPQMKQKVGLGKFLMELKLTTFLIYRRGSVIPMTLKQRSLNI